MHERNMRLVEILAPRPETLDPVLVALREEELDYVVTDESGADGSTVVTLPVPANAVEPVLRRLDDLGVTDDTYTVVQDAEAVVSDRFNHLREDEGEVAPTDRRRIARDELRSTARDVLPARRIYCLLTAIGATLATAGFLLDSLTVVLGAMVIAPLFAPAMAAAVGTVTGDETLARDGLAMQVLGTAVGVASATGFALVVRFAPFADGVFDASAVVSASSLGSSAILLLVVAVGAGVAGAVGLSTDGSTVVTQVMLASALVPPVGVAGAALVWWEPRLVVGALAVNGLNLVAIELAAVVSLWSLGYHPDDWAQLRRTRGRILTLVAGLLALLGVVTFLLVEWSRGGLLPGGVL
ncbi:DUF389 domain-containing protein [Halobaculum litoreum]|uniref:DUF389 domain-containing protein n=1 Tax=Halobaculum litoreum TaxID=3031998 RepID=A0ABD5XM70_9EURY|nr:DUF389 domain-containing protein [Halobaculum sp. DT92]